ncbi:hypothetical protein SH591_12255 [Sphingomonas sp. LY54]|nr:hypothetical protein [Sphingomonas sp. LY54]WRP27872.1 hypothetical protein SH591_12255 [Sphingomonas sp. LY54]
MPALPLDEFVPFRDGERPWTDAGADVVNEQGQPSSRDSRP